MAAHEITVGDRVVLLNDSRALRVLEVTFGLVAPAPVHAVAEWAGGRVR